MVVHLCDTLWSINERLIGRPGADVPRMTTDWAEDMFDMMKAEAEELEQAECARHQDFEDTENGY